MERLVDAPSNPEHLVAVPGGRVAFSLVGCLIILARMLVQGALCLFDPETEEASSIWPGGEQKASHDVRVFADCPAHQTHRLLLHMVWGIEKAA